MRTLKYSIGSALASGVMLLAPAAPVAADTIDSNNNSSTNTSEVITETETNSGIQQEAEDDSKNFAVLGNCSGVFFSRVDLDQSTDLSNGGGGNQEWSEQQPYGANNQSASSTQSATGITFSPDCSTQNVTNVQQAVAAAAAAQVQAPKGGVGAGVGGAVGSSLTAMFGIAGSLGSLGLGLRRFGN